VNESDVSKGLEIKLQCSYYLPFETFLNFLKINIMSKKGYLHWITFVAINGGFLFGLNMAGISGAVNSILDFFNLSDGSLGMVVSILTVGCLVGALFTGYFADKYGRKKVLIFTSVLFAISALGCSLSQSVFMLSFFRLVAGIAVGTVSVIVPMYISEIAPAQKRGTLVSFNQFAIVIGILLAYVFDYFLIDMVDGWRYMLAIPFVFSIMFFVFLLTSFPESPRWLLSRGKKEEAMAVLIRIGGTQYAKDEMQSMEQSINRDSNKEKASFGDLFKGKTGKVVLLGTLLAAFQQITGINAVVCYAPVIFEKTGVGGNIALLQSMLVGSVNFLATIVALWLVDKKGRKTLLLWGAEGMTLALGYLTYAFTFNGNNISIVVAILAYIAFFAASFAPVMWVVTSEMYPNRVRGLALSFSTTVSWLCTFLIVQFSPYILNQFGGATLFGFFGIFSLLAFVFVKIWIPETRGKSLEEIEREIL